MGLMVTTANFAGIYNSLHRSVLVMCWFILMANGNQWQLVETTKSQWSNFMTRVIPNMYDLLLQNTKLKEHWQPHST